MGHSKEDHHSDAFGQIHVSPAERDSMIAAVLMLCLGLLSMKWYKRPKAPAVEMEADVLENTKTLDIELKSIPRPLTDSAHNKDLR